MSDAAQKSGDVRPTRYRELETVVEALSEIDIDSDKLQSLVARLQRKAEKALSFKEAARNPDIKTAQDIGRAKLIAKTNDLRTSLQPVIDELKGQGITSLREITKVLNERNIKTARGGEWTFGALGRLLNR